MLQLSPENLLTVADEFCAAHNVSVRDFSALAGAAAIPGARFHGVTAHDSPRAAARSLAAGIRKLRPLTSLNSEFGDVAATVYRRWSEARQLPPS